MRHCIVQRLGARSLLKHIHGTIDFDGYSLTINVQKYFSRIVIILNTNALECTSG